MFGLLYTYTMLLSVAYAYTVVLNPLGKRDSYFLSTNLTLGSNHQSMNNVGLDTGSAISWFLSKDCKLKGGSACYGTSFDPTTSSSFSGTTLAFTATYDDKTKFSGTYASDVFAIAEGINLPFGLVKKASYPSGDAAYNEALLGLTLSCCDDEKTLLDVWFPDVEKVFTVDLPSSLEDTGLLLLGQRGNGTAVGTVGVELGDEDWTVTSAKVEDTAGNSLSASYSGYLDTGSDFIYVPKKDLISICRYIGWPFNNKQGLCLGACTGVSSLKNFVVNIGGVKLPFSVSDHFTYEVSNGNCALAFLPVPKNQGWTFGMAFLRQFQTEWDFGNSKVSFYPKET